MPCEILHPMVWGTSVNSMALLFKQLICSCLANQYSGKATEVGGPPNSPKLISQLWGTPQPQYFITLLLGPHWTYFWKHYIYCIKDTKIVSQNFGYQIWSTKNKFLDRSQARDISNNNKYMFLLLLILWPINLKRKKFLSWQKYQYHLGVRCVIVIVDGLELPDFTQEAIQGTHWCSHQFWAAILTLTGLLTRSCEYTVRCRYNAVKFLPKYIP